MDDELPEATENYLQRIYGHLNSLVGETAFETNQGFRERIRDDWVDRTVVRRDLDRMAQWAKCDTSNSHIPRQRQIAAFMRTIVKRAERMRDAMIEDAQLDADEKQAELARTKYSQHPLYGRF